MTSLLPLRPDAPDHQVLQARALAAQAVDDALRHLQHDPADARLVHDTPDAIRAELLRLGAEYALGLRHDPRRHPHRVPNLHTDAE
jgi:hypothetical protein